MEAGNTRAFAANTASGTKATREAREADLAQQDAVWSVRRVASLTLVVLAVGLVFAGLVRFYTVLFVFFAALVLHLAFNPLVIWLRKRGVRPGLATILAYIVGLALVGGFVALVVPFIIEQIGVISQRLPAYYAQMRQAALNSGTLEAFANGLPAAINLVTLIPSAPLMPVAGGTSSLTSELATPWVTSAFSVIAIPILAFYWTLNSEQLTYTLILRIPETERETVRTLMVEMEEKVGAFFRGQLILCTFVGVLDLIVYLVIGLPYAIALALIAFVCEAIPMIGPALGAIPAIVVALATMPDKAVYVLIATLVIQQVESNVLVPRVMDRAVGVNAISVILSIIAFSLLFGLAGALLAIPLAAIVQVVLGRLVFHTATSEAAPDTSDLIVELQTTGGRDWVSVLRMEAREIAEDVRKQMRKLETARELSDEHPPIDDAIEAIALDLDSLLAQHDPSPPGAVIRASSVAGRGKSPVVQTDVVASP